MALSIRHFVCILMYSSPGIVQIVMSIRGEKERDENVNIYWSMLYANDLSLIILFLCHAYIASNKS